jgi:alpha-mannosidase
MNECSRELIAEGKTGGLIIFEDHPNYWDAWGKSTFANLSFHSGKMKFNSDVEIHHLETAQALQFTNTEVVADGPLRAAVKTQVRYGKSVINVMVSTAPDIADQR